MIYLDMIKIVGQEHCFRETRNLFVHCGTARKQIKRGRWCSCDLAGPVSISADNARHGIVHLLSWSRANDRIESIEDLVGQALGIVVLV